MDYVFNESFTIDPELERIFSESFLNIKDDKIPPYLYNLIVTPSIKIKVYPDENNIFSFYATAKEMTIDWCDGTVDEYIPNGDYSEFYHRYTNRDFYIISIASEAIKKFKTFSYFPSKGRIYDIKFGNCPELNDIYFSWDIFPTLDVSRLIKLKSLSCGNGKLIALNAKGCIELQRLDCPYNQLTLLDLSDCMELRYLHCVLNQLTHLDLLDCPSLDFLNCGYNQLTQLVFDAALLHELHCSNNKLTKLDLSSCHYINSVYCSFNQLSTSALNLLFESLPVKTPQEGFIVFEGNPGEASCDRTILERKGWRYYPTISTD